MCWYIVLLRSAIRKIEWYIVLPVIINAYIMWGWGKLVSLP